MKGRMERYALSVRDHLRRLSFKTFRIKTCLRKYCVHERFTLWPFWYRIRHVLELSEEDTPPKTLVEHLCMLALAHNQLLGNLYIYTVNVLVCKRIWNICVIQISRLMLVKHFCTLEHVCILENVCTVKHVCTRFTAHFMLRTCLLTFSSQGCCSPGWY